MLEFLISISLSLLLSILLLFGVYYSLQRQVVAYESYQALLCTHMSKNEAACKKQFIRRVRLQLPHVKLISISINQFESLQKEDLFSNIKIVFTEIHPMLPSLQILYKDSVRILSHYRKFHE